MATTMQSRYELSNRYVFKGKLRMQTGLHIGGGKVTLSSSDSPVVLTPDQKPFIPGSSFKGALRSTIEKLVPGLPGFSTCALIELDENELDEEYRQGKKSNEICPTARQGEIARRRRNIQSDAERKRIQKEILDELCDTCRLFGSPFAAAHVNINDLYMSEQELMDIVERRDGVAIDRDTEKARDHLKYDFEVVPASATFVMEIVLENADPAEVQLLCAGLSEYVHGFGVIGGKRSRGLGVAKLEELTVDVLELAGDNIDEATRRQRLQDYLVQRKVTQHYEKGEVFLTEQITNMFSSIGGAR
jgi:CRISPR-associated protein Csm3